ncbi:MAG: tripartite tricarboxylate transporter permease, partial [Nocardioidaceae bacterium]
MFDVLGEALAQLLDPARLGWVVLGATVGFVVGMLPGLGGTVGMSILLPFVFGMDPYSGVALLIGMAAAVHTGDVYPSVLLGVPGSSGSQATVMDGYPLARAGKAARALGASLSASMIGGVIGAIALFGTIMVARPVILALESPQLFMLVLFGLAMVGILAQGTMLAGLLAGLIGALLGCVGAAPAAPEYRFTMGTLYLWEGIPLAVLVLGLFALPEMVDLLAGGESISKSAKLSGGLLSGVRSTLRHWFLVVRSSLLGVAVGVIPGLGGSVVDWIAYGVAKQTCRDSHTFGKGDIRGVIAPESSNNAKEGGALIPTLLFGVPGSGTTAVLLG